MFKKVLLPALILSLSASFVNAQVLVVEGAADDNPGVSSVTAATAQPVGAPGSISGAAQQSTRNSQGELFYQLQLLQDEVMQLRGIIEEQQHLVRQLKQQRLDDYLSLDKRISELSSGSGSMPAASGALVNGDQKSEPASGDETAAYKAAYDLVRAQQFEEAKAAFSQFIKDYPVGRYLPNSLYWLGELYLLDPDLESARQSFAQLLDQFPDHRKAPDAMFKLAKVYHLQGESAKSKALLKRVIDQNGASSAAKLAQDYLQKNF